MRFLVLAWLLTSCTQPTINWPDVEASMATGVEQEDYYIERRNTK